MRQLRVVGLGDDSGTVVLEDPIRHERFAVPSDERLRAAARGDVRRLGQMEIETTSPLRPRDIQARVRAGESVAAVAEGAGVSPGHVERFAYPVLLERARVAELCSRAHPTREGRTDPRTLGEIVATTFAARGQDLDEARWDAWKADGGDWVVALSWQAGRSDNTAHWTFLLGGAGGTVTARDEHARDITGGAPSGPRRAGRDGEPAAGDEPAGGETAETAPEPASAGEPDAGEQVPAPEALAVGAENVGHGGPAATSPGTPPAPPPSAASRTPRGEGGRGRRSGGPAARTAPSSGTSSSNTSSSGGSSASSSSSSSSGSAGKGGRGSRAVPDQRSSSGEEPEDTERGRGKRGKNHPIVPSWEDVLLGVRSPKS